jgi:hypothetical protein
LDFRLQYKGHEINTDNRTSDHRLGTIRQSNRKDFLMNFTLIHLELALLWAKWNGQRGTAKQLTAIAKQLTVADLSRMLTERGVKF